MSTFLVVAIVASSALGQSKPDAKPATDAAAQTTQNSTETKTASPAIDDETRRMAMELRRQLDGSPEQLGEVAHEIGLPLIASLQHDLDIARVNERRKRMEGARVRVVEMAESAKSERLDLLKQMNEELAVIRKQFADDPEICETEGVALVDAFRVRLQALKEREDECKTKADETSKELIVMRRDKVSRERARWLAERTPSLTPTIKSPVPRLVWVQDDSNRIETAPRRNRSVSLKDALAGLKEFE
jgi:hypothetical protein